MKHRTDFWEKLEDDYANLGDVKRVLGPDGALELRIEVKYSVAPNVGSNPADQGLHQVLKRKEALCESSLESKNSRTHRRVNV